MAFNTVKSYSVKSVNLPCFAKNMRHFPHKEKMSFKVLRLLLFLLSAFIIYFEDVQNKFFVEFIFISCILKSPAKLVTGISFHLQMTFLGLKKPLKSSRLPLLLWIISLTFSGTLEGSQRREKQKRRGKIVALLTTTHP